MKVRKAVMFSVAAVAFTLTGCESAPTTEQQLAVAIAQFTEQADIKYQHSFVDLNHDGVDDALVLLTGTNWCGSGGCTLLVLQGKAANKPRFDVISQSTVTRPPIRVAKAENQGWASLIVYSAGAEKWLEFDGHRYPPNPSLTPAATVEQLNDARLLLQ